MRSKASTVTLWVGGQGMVSEKVDARALRGRPSVCCRCSFASHSSVAQRMFG